MSFGRSQSGFTLIELVVVIVLLGILAVTAAPKYLDLSGDARAATVESLNGAAKEALTSVYMKAIIANEESLDRSTSIETNLGTLELKYGYPEAYAENGLSFVDLLDLGTNDWDICYGSSTSSCSQSNSSHVRIGYGISDDPETKCYIRYIEPTGTDNPSNGSSVQTYDLTMETSEC